VLYSGPQPSFLGLDQVNLDIPAALRGRGLVEVLLAVDGIPANPVWISVQ
jgi:uncharacterized protein (TIGR03437 family)